MIIDKLLSRLKSSDGTFLRSSMLLTIGFGVARALGLGFSLLLGRVLPAEQYGVIPSSIFVASLLGMAIQPFAQHILARSISVARDDPAALQRVYNSAMLLLIILLALTLGIVLPLFLITNSFNLGALLIFTGVTLFFTYNGVARGFESSGRLVAVFVGSNLIQLIAILFAYFITPIDSDNPAPAIAIYGLSYLLPVLYLTIFHPLPLKFDLSKADRPEVVTLSKATIPIWVSHVAFTIGAGFDIVLLSQFWGTQAVGAYSMAKTMGLMFDLIPMSLGTLIMPRIARSQTGRVRMVTTSLGIMISGQLIFAVGFLLLYRPLVMALFGPDYLVPQETLVFIVLYSVLWGAHGILTNALIGANYALVETGSRIVILIFFYVFGLVLVPSFGTTGAAMTETFTVLVALLTLPLLLRWRMRATQERQQPAIIGTTEGL